VAPQGCSVVQDPRVQSSELVLCEGPKCLRHGLEIRQSTVTGVAAGRLKDTVLV
jgi:hypothetical protein